MTVVLVRSYSLASGRTSQESDTDTPGRCLRKSSPIRRSCIGLTNELRRHTATDEKGRALDRVAHFHLGNGAIVERLNWLADTSTNGFKQSYAMMVNYRYKLSEVDANHEAYAAGKVIASREVRALARA